MPNTISGELLADPKWRVAIVTARFNELITSKLNGGALDCLTRFGINDDNIDSYWVPGAFEITGLVRQIADKGIYNGIICIGAIIRGSTPHFDYVAAESAKGIAAIGKDYNIPVFNAILTTDTIEQAVERAGTKAGNKGFDSAMGLIEMMSIYKKIEKIK